MYCTQCGAKNEDGAGFCVECGAPLIPEPDSAPSDSPDGGAVSADTSGGYSQQDGNDGYPQGDPNGYGGSSQGDPNGYGDYQQDPNAYGYPQGDPNGYGGYPQDPNAYGGSHQGDSNGYGGSPQGDPNGYGGYPQGDPNSYGGYSQGDPNGYGGSPQGDPNAYGYQQDPNGYQQGGYDPNGYSGQGYGPGGQKPRPPRQPRQPISKLTVAVALEIVAAVALLVGSYMIMDKKLSPETICMNYWEATVAHEWAEAYDYCDFPENEFLTKEMYVNANQTDEEVLRIKSSSIREQASSDQMISSVENLFGEQVSDSIPKVTDMKYYVVEYLTQGSASKEYSSIVLTKTGKKTCLLWDEWKVAPSDQWYQNLSFTIPQDAHLFLNGVEATAKPELLEDGMQRVTVPYLFVGNYQLEVKADGMEPYRDILNVTGYDYNDDYITLHASEEEHTALMEQCGNDLMTLLELGLTGEKFSSVEDYFTSEALKEGNCQENFESLKELEDNGEDEGLVNLKIQNIQIQVQNDAGTSIDLYVTMEAKGAYRSYWDDELDDYESTIEVNAYYQKEDGKWKLTNMPFSNYTF